MRMTHTIVAIVLMFSGLVASTPPASAFCGFYVAKADAKLFNRASKVILVRDGERTVLTMANDFVGEVKDFAIVVPVPVVLEQDQVHIGDPRILERLDAFSAPRLVEYFDPDPCDVRKYYEVMEKRMPAAKMAAPSQERAQALGVKIEAQFSVGEYDILILSATQSSGLETWLNEEGYKIPKGGEKLLASYLKQNMKFFVAKVNLQEFEKKGYSYLRPLMMAFESPKFMLPIRLGMMNADGDQDLLIFAISPNGRVELTNYRTVNIAADKEVPVYIKTEFDTFYRDMFRTAYEREGKNVAFLEYAWDMGWCDPCADNPLTPEELLKAGVFWDVSGGRRRRGGGTHAYITRLHVRYGREKFPEDLMFQETPNMQNFQGRYVLRHPFKGEITCEEGKSYPQQVADRQEREAQTLASLTDWDITSIRKRMELTAAKPVPWWRKIFGEDRK